MTTIEAVILMLVASVSGCVTAPVQADATPAGLASSASTAAVPPAPPPAAAPPAPAGAQPTAIPDGQWVFTSQYGWVWMPYGAAYTYLPAAPDAVPSMYVYTPVFGWRWVAAPWVWGLGPRPWFALAPRHFAWYGHPWLGHAWYEFRVRDWHAGARDSYGRPMRRG